MGGCFGTSMSWCRRLVYCPSWKSYSLISLIVAWQVTSSTPTSCSGARRLSVKGLVLCELSFGEGGRSLFFRSNNLSGDRSHEAFNIIQPLEVEKFCQGQKVLSSLSQHYSSTIMPRPLSHLFRILLVNPSPNVSHIASKTRIDVDWFVAPGPVATFFILLFWRELDLSYVRVQDRTVNIKIETANYCQR